MTTPPAKQRDWMNNLADYMIMHPHLTNIELARYFNVTPVWIGVVKRSDSFGELIKTRREVHATMVSTRVIDKVEALAEQVVEELGDRLTREVVPLEQVREIGDMALKALGFGGRNGSIGAAGVVNNINVTVDREALAAAREKMKQINQPVLQIEGIVSDDNETNNTFDSTR